MTVAITLVIFGVIHSVSHFVNLWNFSRSYDEQWPEINLARYKGESPFLLLISVAGVTGVSMLLIVLGMGLTSTRIVRRKVYNAFWYTHQLYVPFMILLMIHPLSGVLKEEILDEKSLSQDRNVLTNISIPNVPKFAAIQSMTWLWMALPLTCFLLDMLWRIFSRNLARVKILNVSHMPGRTISLSLSCPHAEFSCSAGQYVLVQCSELSIMEWHPFTVVEIPTISQRKFVLWIKVKGDWTEGLEKMLKERGPNNLNVLIDGPFSSPMQGIIRNDIAICIAAGVGITPFVSVLRDILMNPKNRLPGRIHLIWIVRHERELTWIASLATEAILQLRNSNRPDRLHLEFYVTNSQENEPKRNVNKEQKTITHMVVLNEKGYLTHVINDDERRTLLTPNNKRNGCAIEDNMKNDFDFEIAKKYPLIGCRLRRGRPHWDRVFGYWAHLYPEHHLNLYCCGPKKLVKLLRSKCKYSSRFTKTKLTFIHEAFS
ncbi:unnamed protein product [Euphydryas editha]|nr:unnamed protein product [Euphydryas editha]